MGEAPAELKVHRGPWDELLLPASAPGASHIPTSRLPASIPAGAPALPAASTCAEACRCCGAVLSKGTLAAVPAARGCLTCRPEVWAPSVPARGRGRCARRSEPGALKVFRKLLIKGAVASAASSPSFSPTLPAAHTHTGHIAAARLCRQPAAPLPTKAPSCGHGAAAPRSRRSSAGIAARGPPCPSAAQRGETGGSCTVGFSVSSWHAVTPPAHGEPRPGPDHCRLAASPIPHRTHPKGAKCRFVPISTCSAATRVPSHPCLRVRNVWGAFY